MPIVSWSSWASIAGCLKVTKGKTWLRDYVNSLTCGDGCLAGPEAEFLTSRHLRRPRRFLSYWRHGTSRGVALSGRVTATPGADSRRPGVTAKGGEVEVDLSRAVWHTSTFSNGNGGNCVEVATNLHDLVTVRDSKDPEGPTLIFSSRAWAVFTAGVVRENIAW